jgi:hypothetical protein
LKYAFVKKCIDKAVAELQHWHQNFDPSWKLMLTSSNPKIDRQIDNMLSTDQSSYKVNVTISKAKDIRSSSSAESQAESGIWLPKETGQQEEIPHSCARLLQRSKASITKQYIVDSIPLLPEVDSRILA